MSGIEGADLLERLGKQAYGAVENAFGSARLRGNSYVELLHWIEQMSRIEGGDMQRIAAHYGIDPARLSKALTGALDGLPTGGSAAIDISDHVFDAAERGWVFASLLFKAPAVRSGHVLYGCLKTPRLERQLLGAAEDLRRIDLDDLARNFARITEGSPEAKGAAVSGAAAPGAKAGTGAAQGPEGEGGALDKYATDLTQKARDGEIDRIVGRDAEIRQIVNVLMRRRQNNPILTGEAGVGKTAVVEGFALRIAEGDVPPQLRDVSLRMLDVGLLQAGASMKGEFEERLKSVIEEVKQSPVPIILFIDETHTLIGAGGAAGTGDAANLLKPALARGELRTIGATTWAEYKKHIEKDPALTRRFEVVQIDEPDEERALLMMRGIGGMLERHHGVRLLDEALQAAVSLSHRYIPARQLPDKSVSLLDTACARVAVSQHAVPPAVEDSRRRIAGLEARIRVAEREAKIGLDMAEPIATATAEVEAERARLVELEARWEREQALVAEVVHLRRTLDPEGPEEEAARRAAEAGAPELGPDEDLAPKAGAPQTGAPQTGGAGDAAPAPAAATESATASATPSTTAARMEVAVPVAEGPLAVAAAAEAALAAGDGAPATPPPATPASDPRAALADAIARLEAEQGEHPLIHTSVDRNAVAEIVQDWTGIPVGRMVADQIDTVMKLPSILAQRVVGQDHAMEMIARRVQTSRAGLTAPEKPVGVFLLAGPSGVGKTETALALAETLYGGEQNLVTINMSEFQESHTVSTLKGAPPGYVGYGEGGVLTEAVRRKPYSVVLLDEVEKAHSDVHEIFFQVFDKGMMEDGEGRRIDFKNTLILLTSNVGSDLIMKLMEDPDLAPAPEDMADALRPELLKVFPAALLGRLVTIPYKPLDAEMIDAIATLKLRSIQKRIRSVHGAELTYGDDVLALIRERCTEPESGGRMIDAILTNSLLPAVGRHALRRMAEGAPLSAVAVSVTDGEFALEVQ